MSHAPRRCPSASSDLETERSFGIVLRSLLSLDLSHLLGEGCQSRELPYDDVAGRGTQTVKRGSDAFELVFVVLVQGAQRRRRQAGTRGCDHSLKINDVRILRVPVVSGRLDERAEHTAEQSRNSPSPRSLVNVECKGDIVAAYLIEV